MGLLSRLDYRVAAVDFLEPNALRFCFVFDLQAPSAGRVKVLCSGPPGRKPGESCWAMDGPSRRAHGAEPERGNLSEAMAERWGKAFLVPFGAVCQKGPAVRAEPVERRGASNG